MRMGSRELELPQNNDKGLQSLGEREHWELSFLIPYFQSPRAEGCVHMRVVVYTRELRTYKLDYQ